MDTIESQISPTCPLNALKEDPSEVDAALKLRQQATDYFERAHQGRAARIPEVALEDDNRTKYVAGRVMQCLAQQGNGRCQLLRMED